MRADLADISELIDLRIAYLKEDHGGMEADMEADLRRRLASYFHEHINRDLICCIKKEEGKIVSCLFLLTITKPMSPSFVNGRTGMVFNVYTLPEYRHRGCAKELVQEMIQLARVMRLCTIDLKATKAGYGLYKSLGFIEDTSYTEMKLILE